MKYYRLYGPMTLLTLLSALERFEKNLWISNDDTTIEPNAHARPRLPEAINTTFVPTKLSEAEIHHFKYERIMDTFNPQMLRYATNPMSCQSLIDQNSRLSFLFCVFLF